MSTRPEPEAHNPQQLLSGFLTPGRTVVCVILAFIIHCAVIMCTTENTFDQITKALEAGANEYIMKPFDKDILAGKLEAVGVQLEG